MSINDVTDLEKRAEARRNSHISGGKPNRVLKFVADTRATGQRENRI